MFWNRRPCTHEPISTFRRGFVLLPLFPAAIQAPPPTTPPSVGSSWIRRFVLVDDIHPPISDVDDVYYVRRIRIVFRIRHGYRPTRVPNFRDVALTHPNENENKSRIVGAWRGKKIFNANRNGQKIRPRPIIRRTFKFVNDSIRNA